MRNSPKNPVDEYWRIRLDAVKEALEKNNFSAFVAGDVTEAGRIVREEILPGVNAGTISWGSSQTFVQTGLYDELKSDTRFTVLDTYDKSLSAEAMLERRRQSLLVDLFVTGSNAVTENGQLVNLDMIGNRVAGLTFGPKNVIVLAGRNKVVADLEEAMNRIKGLAAPMNTIRLDKKTPCAKTGYCHDCSSPDRICNHWTITEKSWPKGRIRVVLINADLGF